MRVENCLEKLEKLYFVSEKRKPERRDKLNVGIFFSWNFYNRQNK